MVDLCIPSIHSFGNRHYTSNFPSRGLLRGGTAEEEEHVLECMAVSMAEERDEGSQKKTICGGGRPQRRREIWRRPRGRSNPN